MLWVPIECYILEYYDDDGSGAAASASANVTKLIAEQKRSSRKMSFITAYTSMGCISEMMHFYNSLNLPNYSHHYCYILILCKFSKYLFTVFSFCFSKLDNKKL
jgi:hypothetical protein